MGFRQCRTLRDLDFHRVGCAGYPLAMMADRFEVIPAWRISRLRGLLRDAERRGSDRLDAGEDLCHRALRSRFMHGRTRGEQELQSRKTRKGRRFSSGKQRLIWRAILNHRPAGWQSGDKAPWGSIRQAHLEACESCRAASMPPPRYRTVYVLWHRGEPSAEVLETLR